MTVPAGKFITKTLHNAPEGAEDSEEMIVSGTDGAYTLVALGVVDLTGTIELQVRVLTGEWVTVPVTDVSDDSEVASITADGVYTRMVAGMTALRTSLDGSAVTCVARLVA